MIKKLRGEFRRRVNRPWTRGLAMDKILLLKRERVVAFEALAKRVNKTAYNNNNKNKVKDLCIIIHRTTATPRTLPFEN